MSGSVVAQTFPVLVSAMMTRRNDEQEEDIGSATPFIKNTFIEVPAFEETTLEQSPRRASSAPPLWRKRAGLESYPSDDEIFRQPGTESAASTSARDLSEAGHTDEYADTDDEAGALQPPSAEAAPEVLRIALSTSAPEPRVALSTHACGFLPVAPCWPQLGACAQLTPDAKHDFAAVVASGLGVLRASDLVERSEVVESVRGWTLSCTLRSANAREAITEEVQRAVLHAAEVSNNTYVVGYDAAPFVSLVGVVGFSVQLAVVRDEQKACWDFLQSGACSRGYSCRWQHPLEQVVLEVVINL